MNLFDASVDDLVSRAELIAAEIAALPLEQQVDALNRIRQTLHAVSPFAAEPVDCVLWLPADNVQANDYNPNRVAPPEMKLLRRSIRQDGYTQPIVGYSETGSLDEPVEVVDGFHRNRVGKEDKQVAARIRGYLPVTIINTSRTDRKDRMAATIRHNRARGIHAVMPMTDIVAGLIRQGWDDAEIAAELGMDADEVLRFKHHSGLPELFRNGAYSMAWE
jgi:ParB-like chromosome segregation protein Spo0J